MRYFIYVACFLAVTSLLLFCFSQRGYAQSPAIDSISQVAENATTDSLKIEALRALAVRVSDYDVSQAIDYAEQAIELAKSNHYDSQLADATNSLGIVYYGLGDYEKTLECFYQVLAFYEARDNKKALSRIYNNVGLLLKELGRYTESVTYLEKSIALKLNTGDTGTLPSSYNNLGSVYDEGLKDYKKAATYYWKALELDSVNNDSYGAFVSLGNIGYNQYKRGNLDSAQYYYNKAVMLIDKTDDRYIKARFLYNFALLNAATGRYERAIEKHHMSIDMAKEADARLILRDNYAGLSDIFANRKNYREALRYHKMYSDLNRDLFNADQNTKIADIESSFKMQAKQNEIELLKKEAEIKDLRLSNREMALYWLGGMLLLVGLILVLLYRRNIYRNKTHKLLKRQNEEIISKNRNIMDSILYARTIQEAILPENERLKNIFEDAFILTKPRDVVNGDFYWFAEEQNKVIIAAVDCTGHGVPAAFLNVMGNSLLNQVVNEEKILEPREILKELNQRLLKNLKYNNLQNNTTDGMDIGICQFNRKTRRLSFAGAKRPLYYFHNHELNILKGDQYPVGGIFYDEYREYRQHELILQATDSIYLFTDGIVDQFGGEKNKKFMYPRFRELLMRISSEPMEKQVITIEQELSKWQGNNEQTDDILLIGVRV